MHISRPGRVHSFYRRGFGFGFGLGFALALLIAFWPQHAYANLADGDIPGIPITASPVIGALSDTTDVSDVYAVPLLAGEHLSAAIEGPDGTDFDLNLYAPDALSVTSDSPVQRAAGEAYPDAFGYTAPVTGTYYLQASAYSGSGECTLTWQVSAYATDDDVPGVAAPASPITGALNDVNDRNDVYAIDMQAGQSIDVNIADNSAAGACGAQMWSPGCVTVDSVDMPWLDGVGTFGPGSFTFTAPATATYYLDVFSLIGGEPSCSYTLDYRIGADDGEIPGIPITASPVIGSLSDLTDWSDVYAVPLLAGQYLSAAIEGPDGTDFDLNLYAPDATSVSSDSPVQRAAGESYPDALGYTAPVTGTYYLQTRAFSGSGECTLTWEVSANAADNDIPGVGVPASPINGALDDVDDRNDVYAIDMQAGQSINVNIADNSASGWECGAQIWSPSAPTVNDIPQPWMDGYGTFAPGSFTFIAPTTDTYYLDVFSMIGGEPSCSYTLEYSRSMPDDDIPGVPASGSPIVGSLDSMNDLSDVCSISLQAGDRIAASIVGSAGTDFDLALYSPEATSTAMGEPVAGAHANVFPDGLTHIAPATGTYYLQAYVVSGSGPYALSYAVTTPSHVKGSVSGPTGGISGIDVTAYGWSVDSGAWEPVLRTASGAGGDYDIGGLPAGEYRIGFTAPSGEYFDRFYGGAADVGSALSVSVAEGVIRDGVDVVLTRGARLSGVVSALPSTQLEGVDVSAYQWNPGTGGWDDVGSATTGSGGSYSIPRLEPGTYRVGFSDSTYVHVNEFYSGAVDLESARDIVVGAGDTVNDIDASLATAGHISGVVSDVDGPLKDARAVAYAWSEVQGSWSQVGWATTDVSGTYQIQGLPGGDYRIEFYDAAGDYFNEYYRDAGDIDTSEVVTVIPGQVTSGIDAHLSAVGRIAGTVIGPDGPVQGASITLYEWDDASQWWQSGMDQILTGADGRYDISGLRSGNYRVAFHDPSGACVDQYYGAARDIGSAADVIVLEGLTTSGIDALLESAGHITGSVSGPGGSLADVEVTAYAWNAALEYWESVAATSTDVAGSYKLSGLATGEYRLGYMDGSGMHVGQCYSNAPDLDSASDVSVIAGQTTGNKDVVLALAGHITGTVTGTGGEGDFWVVAYKWSAALDDWDAVGQATAEADGSYDVGGLSAGVYRLGFQDWSGTHIGEYYDNSEQLVAAADLEVVSGGTVSGIDAELAPSGHISGTVTGPDGPLGDVGVTVAAPDEIGSLGEVEMLDAITAEDGTFDVSGLASGTYCVLFSDGDSASIIDEYYDNARSPFDAKRVVVVAGQTTTGIDATVAFGGSLSGVVTGPSGAIAGVQVTANHWDSDVGGWETAGSAVTDAEGVYEVSELPEGDYRVGFWDPSGMHIDEYYRDAASVDAAQDVTVADRRRTGGIDASLESAGHITGTVTAPTGPTEGVAVVVYGWRADTGTWESLNAVGADVDGTYDIGGLTTGTYRVGFVAESGLYAKMYYTNATDVDSATGVSVVQGASTDGIDAVFSLDTAAPVTIATVSPSDWTTGTVEVALSYSDDSGQAMGEWTRYTVGTGPLQFYRFEGDDFVFPDVPTKLVISSEGVTTVSFQSKDWAGNVEDTRTVQARIDRTAPTTRAQGAGPYVGSASVGLLASDPLSGVRGTRYRLDGSSWSSGTVCVTSVVGEHVLEFYSIDVAGNVEPIQREMLSVAAPPAPLPVACRLSTPRVSGKAAARKGTTLVGGLSPAHATRVNLEVQVLKRKKYVRYKKYGTGSSASGAWKYRAKLKKGTYRVRALTGSDASYYAGRSGWRKVVVK